MTIHAQKMFKFTAESFRCGVGFTPVRARYHFSTSRRSLGKPLPNSHQLITLDPKRMVEAGQPLCDISARSQPLIHFYSKINPLETTHSRSPIYYKLSREDQQVLRHRFPLSTRGVFYYHRSQPEVSSSIRFRNCDDSSPSSFSAGHDLLLPPTSYGERHPWIIPLVSVAAVETYQAFGKCLLREGLVQPQLLNKLKELTLGSLRRQPLYTLNQPFVVDLSSVMTWVTFITEKNMFRDANFKFFSDVKSHRAIYTGHVRVRFVKSDLPQHKANPSLLLQCLEVLTPIEHLYPEPPTVKPPVPGEYVQRLLYGKFRPWNLSLKKRLYGREIAKLFDIPM